MRSTAERGSASASRRLGAVLAAVATLATQASLGAAPTQGDVAAADAIVADWIETERIPGAVLLMSRDGRVVHERAYGWAWLNEYREGEYGASAAGESRPDAIRRLADPRPMRTDTVFDLASVTKVMATTFAVMLLVDAGELELDAPVHTYLPDFRGGGKEGITLRHLLTHRSGLYQWQPVYYHAGDSAEAYAYIRDLPLAWEVGAERHYSDLGFMILGLVVERVSGQALGAFLEERLYGPLGLRATGFRPNPTGGPIAGPIAGPTAAPTARPADGAGSGAGPPAFAATSHGNPFEHRMVHDLDFGYRIEGDPDAWDGWRRYTLSGEVNDGNAYHAFGGAAGHAGLFSTAGELQVLLQLLLDRGEHDGRRYLSPEVVDLFLVPAGAAANGAAPGSAAPAGDGQALGWQVPDYAPPGSFVHTGFTGTYVLGIPATGTAVVLLTNRQNLGVDAEGRYPDLGDLQRAVGRALTGS